MSKCELCKAPARIYCESDLALLCWNCDAKVHSANFLVARHLRNLLCQVCLLPTPWNASGSRLSPGTSICIKCVSGCDRTKFGRVRVENEDIESGSECMEEVIDENEDEDQLFTTTTDDDEENQVAPCSDVTPPPPPPAVLRRFWNSDRTDCLKRMRVNNPDLRSNNDDDDDDCSSCFGGSSYGISDSSSRALKLQRVDTYGEEEEEEEERSGSKSATIIETVIEEQKMLKVGDDEETTAAIDGGNWKRRFL